MSKNMVNDNIEHECTKVILEMESLTIRLEIIIVMPVL